MRKLSITTTQNVSIDFAVASLGQRIMGLSIDMIAIAVGVFILLLVFSSIHPNLAYLALLYFFVYTPVSEILMNGQTLGKRLASTRVINIYGEAAAIDDLLIRWVFRMVDIWFSLGALGIIFISTTSRGQRLGGVLSNTMVVSLRSEMNLSLDDILRIEDRSVYEPIYKQVYRFKEEEMLAVKQLLDRYERYHNEAHKKLLAKASERCAKVLGLDHVPEKHHDFLKTLIKDYIVSTRS